MTSNEINAAVAVIEGWVPHEFVQFSGVKLPGWMHKKSTKSWMANGHPPPFTDQWALCGPLIDKHKLEIIWNEDGSCVVRDFITQGVKANIRDMDLKCAICLAVIEANKEN